MSTKRKYAETDDSTSEGDSDHSDYTDEDQENEHETDPLGSFQNGSNDKKNAGISRADGDFLLQMVLKKKRPGTRHI